MANSTLLDLSGDALPAPGHAVRLRQGVSPAALEAGGPPARARLPGWLLVGSTGRNAGKTEFACAVIRAVRGAHPIVGVKVTAIVEGESACPRGGAGCGVCAALGGDFAIDEETGEHPGKDTARMLHSGARRVFWVRCRRQRMPAAIAALRARLAAGSLVVAESNSLARAIEPDLFLMVTNGRISSAKPTAAAVMPLADRLVLSAGGAFDPDPRHLAVLDGVWHLAEGSAAILAGGNRGRMGPEASRLPVTGRPLVRQLCEQLAQRFDEILISTDEPETDAFPGARPVPGMGPGTGPLVGIASALAVARHERLFVTAGDAPVVDLDSVARMLVLAEDCDCVVPRTPAGHEPPFAVCRRSALPAMRDALEAGEQRISAVLHRVRTRFVDPGRAPWHRNPDAREGGAAFPGTPWSGVFTTAP